MRYKIFFQKLFLRNKSLTCDSQMLALLYQVKRRLNETPRKGNCERRVMGSVIRAAFNLDVASVLLHDVLSNPRLLKCVKRAALARQFAGFAIYESSDGIFLHTAGTTLCGAVRKLPVSCSTFSSSTRGCTGFASSSKSWPWDRASSII